MVNVIKDFEKAGFVTHAGKFHADEVFGTILMEKIYGKVNLIRLPETDNYNLDGKIVYNIDDCCEMFDRNFVQFVDAGDNGQIPFENIEIKLETVSDIIEDFNPNWNEEIDTDIKFMEALNIARVIFDNKIKSVISKCRTSSNG